MTGKISLVSIFEKDNKAIQFNCEGKTFYEQAVCVICDKMVILQRETKINKRNLHFKILYTDGLIQKTTRL